MATPKKTPKAKRLPEPVTYADFLAREEAQFQIHKRHCAPPPVGYRFVMGEPVRYGNRPDARIEEIRDDGMVIHVSVADKGESYGRPYDNNRRLPCLLWWHELTPLTPIEPTHFGRERRIGTHYSQQMMESLIHTCYFRGILDNPVYQRDYVWTQADKERLIGSIFDRADIGKFVTMSHPWPENRLEIIDGKQRLRAIMDFREGRFAFKGKTWFNLSESDRYIFGDLMVQVCQLDREHIKDSDVLWLFLTINRGGVPQTDEQIAKVQAMYEAALLREAANPDPKEP